MNKKGQVTPVGIIITFIAVVIFSLLLPTLNTVISDACVTADATTCFVLQMIPWMIGLGLIVSIFIFAQPLFSNR